MSLQAIEAAVNTPAPSHAAKLVMFALAYHHNSLTGRCFPSYDRLAKETGLNKSSVIRAVTELCGAQLLRKHKGRGKAHGQASNSYTLVFMSQRVMDLQGSRTVQPDRESPPPTAKASGVGGAVSPKPKRPTRAKPRTRISESWKPRSEEKKFALESGFSPEETTTMALDFRLYWEGEGKTKANWNATFKRWIINQIKFRSRDDGRTGTPTERRGAERQDAIRRSHLAAMAAVHGFGGRQGGDPPDCLKSDEDG